MVGQALPVGLVDEPDEQNADAEDRQQNEVDDDLAAEFWFGRVRDELEGLALRRSALRAARVMVVREPGVAAVAAAVGEWLHGVRG